MRVYPGQPYPLGATWDGRGVNFALFSENATKVELCLYENEYATRESHRIALPEYTDLVWHGYFPDLRPGQVYGFRVHGPYDPMNGLRFNPKKVLVDPYAKAIVRPLRWHDAMFGYRIGSPKEDLSRDNRVNDAYAPLCAVIDPAFTWGDDRPPRTPWHKTVIYETHVKGLTMRHPDVPEELRGTYAGLASEPIIRYLKELGVTAIELMPVHHCLDDRFLIEKGLSNYWGYNTLSFFAPDLRFSSFKGRLDPVREFKMMVRALHDAGLEVILDVVYNHTAEGNQMGPTLSFRGIDNPSYYRLHEGRYYKDFTGCGNTLNMLHPKVLQLVMDSLRYWIQEMHVDGFRFDLASALARELNEVNKLGAFFDIIHQDPVISQVKLIAEPWDLGEGGYQVGNFPVMWTEWNGKYRDTMRSFWKGDGGLLSQFATRFAGSSDLYENDGRKPHASINFITAHDGFTMMDLVSYNEKHNEANGEENRDGESHNHSWNCGAEGPTNDPDIKKLREQQRRNLMATLLLSLGVPMISGGDEIGRTQHGNNNTYGQDNELNWYDWNLTEENRNFLKFVKQMIALRQSEPVLQRRKFFKGDISRNIHVKDVQWYQPAGIEMEEPDWNDGLARSIGILLDGTAMDELDEKGRKVIGDTLLILVNASHVEVPFTLLAYLPGGRWELLVDTAESAEKEFWKGQDVYPLIPRSTVVFKLMASAEDPLFCPLPAD